MTRLRLHLVLALLALLGILPGSLAQTYSALQNSPSTANPFDAKLAEFRNAFASETAPAQAATLACAYEVRGLLGNPAVLGDWFAQVVKDDRLDPLVRDEALRYSALMDVHFGKLSGAQAKWADLGLLRDWTVVGPFTSVPTTATAGFVSGSELPDRGAVRKARTLPAVGPVGAINLAHIFPEVTTGFVLAAASVHADTARTLTLRFGADGPSTLFVNGNQVVESRSNIRFAFDQRVVTVDLKAGDNSVVVALQKSSTETWKFSARLSSTGGDLVDRAHTAVESEPNSAVALETLGILEQSRGLDGALDSFEEAMRISPSAEGWLRVASACSDTTCTFAALNAAHTLAPKDAEVAARLADYYVVRNQTEKASTLLAAASNADFTIHVREAELAFRSGRRGEALAQVAAVERQFPSVAWVQANAAQLYAQSEMLDQAIASFTAALKSGFDDTALRTQLASVYQRRHDPTHLQGLYSDALKLDATNIPAAAQLARSTGALGDDASAQSQLRQAIALAPNDADLHVQLADELGLAGQGSESRLELSRAAEVAPENDEVRRRLTLDSGQPVADDDASYLVDAAQLAAAARKSAPADHVNAIDLADVRLVHVADNGVSTVRSQQVVYIANEQGVRDYLSRSISYAPGSQKLQVMHARLFKSDGRIVTAEDDGDSGPSDAASAMYYDTQSRSLNFAGLQKGDVLELDYRILPTTNVNPYGDYFGELETFGSSVPRKLQRYVVIAPASLGLHVSEQRLSHVVEKSAGTEVVRSWEMHDLSALPTEPRGPATTEVAPYVTVSTFANWTGLGQWYAQLIAPQFKLDAALRDQLTKLIAETKTDEEKITAIHHFVLRNTHYVALEFGVFSYKPYPVSQVYARRFGDCKDKASLMIALLRAAGIEADIALVRTRRMGDVANDATAISVFNHAVVYVPKYDMWLDGTAEYAGSHELPIDDQGAQALTVSLDGNAQLRRIPVTLPMENYTHRQVRAQLEPDGRIEFTGSAYTRGEDAPGLRRDYEVTERQRSSFRNRLAEVLPSVQVDNVEVNGAHDLESDVIVNFSGDLESFAGRRVVTLTPSWMSRSYVQTLASLNSRKEDLILPAPWTTEEELHFVLPNGARIESLPQDTNLDTPFGTAVVRYHRDGNELVVKTSVQFRKLRIAPGEYASFRDFCSQIENAFHNEIKVGL